MRQEPILGAPILDGGGGTGHVLELTHLITASAPGRYGRQKGPEGNRTSVKVRRTCVSISTCVSMRDHEGFPEASLGGRPANFN